MDGDEVGWVKMTGLRWDERQWDGTQLEGIVWNGWDGMRWEEKRGWDGVEEKEWLLLPLAQVPLQVDLEGSKCVSGTDRVG